MVDKLFDNKLCTCFLTIGNNCHYYEQITDHSLCLGTTERSLIKDKGFFFQLVYIENLTNIPQKISIISQTYTRKGFQKFLNFLSRKKFRNKKH